VSAGPGPELARVGEGRSPSRLPGVFWLVGGVLVLASIALPWYTYSALGADRSLTGIDLLAYLPELGLLIAGGVGLTLFGIVFARRVAWERGYAAEPPARWGTTLVALGVLLLPILSAYRFDATATSRWGAAFLDSAGVGWYLAIVGGTFALLGALGLWIPSRAARA
jgi:hypothetical protein